MRRFRPFLSTTLVLLLLVLSFNAYACLLPARQVCDAFKTFNVEASGQSQPTFDSQMVWFGETVSGVLLSLPFTNGILKYPFPSDSSSQLLRTSTIVLRI